MSTIQTGEVSTDADTVKRRENGRCANVIMKATILMITERIDAQLVMKDVVMGSRYGHAVVIDTRNRMNRIEQ